LSVRNRTFGGVERRSRRLAGRPDGKLCARGRAEADDMSRAARPGGGRLSESEEQALVARARSGDRAAFEALVVEYADRLYAVVLRFCASDADAQEATQEAFVRAWRGIARFRTDARFFTWLYRIGVNEAKRLAGRQPRAGTVVSVEERPVDDISDDEPGPHPRAERAELREALEAAVRRLPDKYRAAVVLRDIAGLSTAEAAEALGLREAAFKSRLHRGRMALRRELGGHIAADAS
jgi:RNA polymerase sigma-70 factor (ECF subfamily)